MPEAMVEIAAADALCPDIVASPVSLMVNLHSIRYKNTHIKNIGKIKCAPALSVVGLT